MTNVLVMKSLVYLMNVLCLILMVTTSPETIEIELNP